MRMNLPPECRTARFSVQFQSTSIAPKLPVLQNEQSPILEPRSNIRHLQTKITLRTTLRIPIYITAR